MRHPIIWSVLDGRTGGGSVRGKLLQPLTLVYDYRALLGKQHYAHVKRKCIKS